MYSPFQLTKKYLKYYFTASNGKGHGVHSPFVFEFIKYVLNDKKEYSCYNSIEKIRKHLLENSNIIEVEDFGAGSTVIKTKNRVVKSIAASSLKSKKFSRLLFRIVQYYHKKSVLELGTSLGTSTAYLASANNVSVTTMEGSKSIAQIARDNFSQLGLNNIDIIEGDFNNTLPVFLSANKNIDLVFLDGNHRKKSTLEYFEALLLNASEETIFVFDDIHWSEEMEEAWEIVKQNQKVTLTIDLFFIGIVLLGKDFKAKQHFTIRF
ncbi:MAG: O-methyltransferase [Ferruginibacter sp.]